MTCLCEHARRTTWSSPHRTQRGKVSSGRACLSMRCGPPGPVKRLGADQAKVSAWLRLLVALRSRSCRRRAARNMRKLAPRTRPPPPNPTKGSNQRTRHEHERKIPGTVAGTFAVRSLTFFVPQALARLQPAPGHRPAGPVLPPAKCWRDHSSSRGLTASLSPR